MTVNLTIANPFALTFHTEVNNDCSIMAEQNDTIVYRLVPYKSLLHSANPPATRQEFS